MARVSRKPGKEPEQAKGNSGIRAWNAAMYVRLSVEDNGKDSDSIESQIALLEKYVAACPELRCVGLFVDNGYTGTNFHRPEYMRMMEKVKTGEVDCIVVKDLSRFGRNYIETSRFIERICPVLNLRLISVNDGFDTLTLTNESRLSASLSNIINDYYAKDISRKVRSSLQTKMENGDFVANYAPYGYEKDPQNKNRLLICPETAEVVRRIFAWRSEGASYMGICKRLNDAGVPSPGEHRLAHGIRTNNNGKARKILWNKHMLTSILENSVYIGHLVQRKHSTCLYAGIPMHVTDASERIFVKHAHPALVDEALFERVQQVNASEKQRTKETAGKYDHLPKAVNLYGKRFVCAHCGKVMKLHRSFSRNRDKVYFMFKCPTWQEHGERGCRDVKMRKADVDRMMLESIKAQIAAFAQRQSVFDALMKRKKDCNLIENARKQLSELRRKRQMKTSMLGDLYTDLKTGVLTQTDYEEHRAVILGDIQALDEQIAEMEKPEKELACFEKNEFRWKKLLRLYADASEITPELIDAFVERMALHEDQTLDICFSFQDEMALLDDMTQKLKGAG